METNFLHFHAYFFKWRCIIPGDKSCVNSLVSHDKYEINSVKSFAPLSGFLILFKKLRTNLYSDGLFLYLALSPLRLSVLLIYNWEAHVDILTNPCVLFINDGTMYLIL